MLEIMRLKQKSRKQMYNYLLLAFVCIFFTACGTKTTSMVDSDSDILVLTEDSTYEDYSLALDDDGVPLTKPQELAFRTRGELDRNLTVSELREVHIYYKNYLHKSRMTIERFMYRALPYLAYTREVFRSRGLPEELAYLAFIESGYNPWAVSRSRAMGMWQFMSPTGRHYGLVQDWWMDERRDPYKATHAAADYLAVLYGYFDDWLLAAAAYNAGEGKIGRALKATGAKSFFELAAKNDTMPKGKLRLKEETLQYVPRYLAMIKIMRNFEALGFEPEEHSLTGGKRMITEPAVEIKAKPGTDLASIAKELDMDWSLFAAYNPAFRRYITPPDRETKFYVPQYLEKQALAASKSTKNVGWSTYKIVRGDTLSKVSKRTGVPISVLRQSNRKSEPLQIGAILRVPGRVGTVNSYVASTKVDKVPSGPGYTYEVRSGDTFGQIASRHNLSVKKLAAANPSIRNVRSIKLGQRLFIPSTLSVAQETNKISKQLKPQPKSNLKPIKAEPTRTATMSEVAQIESKNGSHVIKKGDTFYSISKQYGMAISSLRRLNPYLDANDLKLGQRINLIEENTPVYATYTVVKGDSFTAIARKHGMSVAELTQANSQLKYRARLALGQKIYIPKSRNLVAQLSAEEVNRKPSMKTPSRAKTVYLVKKGDSFHSISRDNGLTQDQLASVNPAITSRANISIGQAINIPDLFLFSSTPQKEYTTQLYIVKKGDTYWSISQRFGMKTDELLALNSLTKRDSLSIGAKIKVQNN